MRRNALTGLDSLDLETREAAEAAARRSGMSLDEWIAATLAGQAAPRPAPATKRPKRRPADDLEAAIAKITKATRHRPNHELEAIIAAAAADGERHARDHSARTAVALDSVASWIEQAEERLNEANRATAHQQDRLATALSEALAAIKDRLDSVERRIEAERDDMERARTEAPPPPVLADAFASLRNDMALLIARVEATREAACPPAVDEIRAEIGRLQQALVGLATRDEVAGLEKLVRSLADDLSQARSGQDILSLSKAVADLQRQVQQASKEIGAGLHQRISGEVEDLRLRIDQVATSGVDRTIVDGLMSQVAEMRQALARMAEPQRVERLSEEITALGRLMAEMRLNQIGRNDFASLKGALEDIRSAMKRSEEDKASSAIPEQLRGLSQRIDQLASRPASAAADPVREQLKALTDRLSSLASDKSKQSETVAGLMDRLSSQFATVSDRLLSQPKDVLDRLDRIEDGLRQVGQDSDTAQIELMLRSVQERLERAPMSPGSLEGLERHIEALTSKLQDIGPVGALQEAVVETLSQVKSMRDEAGQITERAVMAAIREIRDNAAPPSPEQADALRQGFAELKALQANADKRTQQTLKAVQNALETLVLRSPAPLPNVTWTSPEAAGPVSEQGGEAPAVRLEAAVRRLHAAAISHVEEVTTSSLETEAAEAPAAAEEVLLEPGTPRGAPPSATSFPAAHEAEPAHVRASFIAAARRAVLAAKDDRAGSADQAVQDKAGPAISNQTLIERIRQTFDHHRRPLLLSLAILILAAGTMQIVGTAGREEIASAPLPAIAERTVAVDRAVEPETAAGPTHVDPEAEVQPSVTDVTGSLLEPKALSVGSEQPASFSKRVADIASVGELPSSLPPSLRDAALIGEPAAVYEVAARLAEGRDGTQNPELAARLFEKAATAGIVPAQYRLGNLYEKGFGVARDSALARTWYERAAEGGNARAMHNLGVLLAEGVNGKPDYAAAQRWFLAAAEHGVKDSQYNLGVLLARGLGVGQDLAQSYKWFALAADQGDQEALRKRDEVAARLPPADLAAAKAAVAKWTPRAGDPSANEIPPPPQGWTSLQPVPRRG